MQLYLARHGNYQAHDIHGQNELTPEGINDITRLADFFHPLGLSLTNIFHSGKKRAQQTADLLVSGFITIHPPQEKSGLQPNDDVITLAQEISSWETDTLLVGHLPFMDRLLSYLVTGDENKNIVDFQPGTVVNLQEASTTRWIINWVIRPAIINNELTRHIG